MTIINAITLYAHFRGWTKEQVQIDLYMPVLNVLVQVVATIVYQWVEGSIDREAQKQQVYVMHGSAPVADETAAASSSGTTSAAANPLSGGTQPDANLSQQERHRRCDMDAQGEE